MLTSNSYRPIDYNLLQTCGKRAQAKALTACRIDFFNFTIISPWQLIIRRYLQFLKDHILAVLQSNPNQFKMLAIWLSILCKL